MKKIVFAFQIFGLIALLPVCVAFEINHGTKSPVNSKSVTENKEAASMEFGSSITKYPIAALAFSQLTIKTKQKSGNAGCTCQDCKCAGNCTCNDN